MGSTTPPSAPPDGDAELDVLKALWDLGPATVRELETRLGRRGGGRRRRWAYNTVLTLLSRLRDKGYVASVKDAFDLYLGKGGRAYVDRDRLTAAEAMQLIHRAGGVDDVEHPHPRLPHPLPEARRPG